MIQPLALVLYEKLLPGTQLVNRLQDLKYRVLTVTDADQLLVCTRQEKPMLVVVDLVSAGKDVCGIIAQLKRDASTEHVPIIAFAPEEAVDLQNAARTAGATLVASDTGMLNHLSQFLDQALQVE